jgi:predicted phage terminase large subunit-like protein
MNSPHIMKLPSLARIDEELARKSLAEFTKQAWEVLEPGVPLQWNWHLDCICDHVQALLDGTLGKQNLVINVCPGSAKSTVVNVAAPAWRWLAKPGWSGIFASANDSVCSRDADKCKQIIESQWYKGTFRPRFWIRRGQDTKWFYKNNKQGFRMAVTTGGRIMGDRADSLFVDDPNDPDDFSEVGFKRIQNWWSQRFWRRLKSMEFGTRCIIMQRIGQLDLTEYVHGLLGDDVEVVSIPLLWQEAKRKTTSLGWTDPRKEENECMHPERYSAKVVAQEKLLLGERGFGAQYQQEASAMQGDIFRKGFVRFINPKQIPVKSIIQRLLSVDSATKEEEQNDYSVILEGWEFDRGVLLRRCWRDKVKYPALKERLRIEGALAKPSAVLIEDKQTGQALIQELQQYTSLPIVPIQVSKDKVARAWPLTPYWEAGRIFLPCDDDGNPEDWVAEFLTEVYSFPGVGNAHDDQVDALTQLLNYIILAPGARGLLAYYNAELKVAEAASKEQKDMDTQHHVVIQTKLMGAK